jgi:hypothetical protein
VFNPINSTPEHNSMFRDTAKVPRGATHDFCLMDHGKKTAMELRTSSTQFILWEKHVGNAGLAKPRYNHHTPQWRRNSGCECIPNGDGCHGGGTIKPYGCRFENMSPYGRTAKEFTRGW